jgi:hypothetical protein
MGFAVGIEVFGELAAVVVMTRTNYNTKGMHQQTIKLIEDAGCPCARCCVARRTRVAAGARSYVSGRRSVAASRRLRKLVGEAVVEVDAIADSEGLTFFNHELLSRLRAEVDRWLMQRSR